MTKLKGIVTVALCLCCVQGYAQQQNKLLIAAASDLKFALDSIISVFRIKSPDVNINVTYGSSGKLFEQISNGGPFDMFFSADIDYPNKLTEKGLTISSVESYGKGRIVLWCNKIDPGQEGMNTLLNPSLKKIAIANPAHAPYGKRAAESLNFYKLDEKVKEKLVYGENISQTAQFVTTGAADAGIIALSLALSPAMKREHGKYYLIPESSHQPLVQGFVALSHAKGIKGAMQFRDFMMSTQVKSILTSFGFTGTD